MRMHEILQETTVAGDIAPVSFPISIIQRRSGNAKYSTQRKKKPDYARRRS